MTPQDITLIALTAYRENRGGLPQPAAMQSVVNVILNRSKKFNHDPYTVCTTHDQFSSVSVPGPESCLWGADADPQWQLALSLAAQAAAGTLADITNSSTDYYAPRGIKTTASFTLPNGTVIPFPMGWNPDAVTFQVEIANQVFFTE